MTVGWNDFQVFIEKPRESNQADVLDTDLITEPHCSLTHTTCKTVIYKL